VSRALASYPEFNEVHPSFSTSGGGVFVVYGRVASAEQLAHLKNVVMATNPPVKVRFLVRVVHPQHGL
jgi:hypothetical protein